ncbi:MAG: signal transduction histidine kinase, partial [Saprospiraceae bacterium]
RNNGLSQFLITEKFDGKMVPVNNREVYYPVFYLEPFIGNEKAIGFDLASDLTRRSAIEKSIALDSLVATARITLVQEKSSQKAILVFCPHKKETELIGLFSGVFRIEDLINSALGHLVNSECNLNIYDISAEEGSQLLAQIGAQDFPPLPDDTAINIPKGIHYQQKIKIADREWLILSTPTQSYLNSFPKSALLILIICIILSMGVLYFLYRNFKEINQRKSIEREVINAIIFSQEEDRDYFAEDLHEGLAQTLFGLSFHIRAVESKFKESDDESLKSSLSLIKEYIYQSLENARKLSKDLMPRSMMKYGLIASLEQHIDNLKTTSDLNIVFNSNKNELKIDKDIEITIYRSIVAIFEKVKASPSSKNISIEINDDESTLQVKIEIFRQITFINDLHIKSNNSLLPFQKRIELHGGQLIIDKEAKKNRTIVIIQFDTKTKKAKFLKKEMGISTY